MQQLVHGPYSDITMTRSPHAYFMIFLNSPSPRFSHTFLATSIQMHTLPSPHLNTSNQLADSTYPPERAVLWILSSLPEISSSSLQQMKFLVTPLQVTNIATSWCIHPRLSILFFFFFLSLHMLQLVTLESLVKKTKSVYLWSIAGAFILYCLKRR